LHYFYNNFLGLFHHIKAYGEFISCPFIIGYSKIIHQLGNYILSPHAINTTEDIIMKPIPEQISDPNPKPVNSTKKAKVGRPRQDTQSREQLILAARALFVERDYAQVSTRELAKKAGTDPALIRYYFGSKEGLFSTMIRETAVPVKQQLRQLNRSLGADGPANFMQTYYRVMAAHPHFPRLIFKLASLDQSQAKNQELTQAFNEIINLEDLLFFDKLKSQGLLRQEVDSRCAQLSFFAMMVFPFLVPEVFLNKLGLEINPEFLRHLAAQNSQLLAHGLFKSEEPHHESK
jgi:AcrR family transcriptional regulator